MATTPVYIRPAATVQEEFAAIAQAVIQPQLAVIIGANKQVLQYITADRPNIGYGAYNPNADATYNYLSLPVGGVVDQTSPQLILENVFAPIATFTSANTIERGAVANQLQFNSNVSNGYFASFNNGTTNFPRNAAFRNRDVRVGDQLTLTANSQTLTTRVIGLVNNVVPATINSPAVDASVPTTQSYSGSVSTVNAGGTDHSVAITTANSQYVGSLSKGYINDVYTIGVVTAGTVGVQQVETATLAGNITVNGNINITITSAALGSSSPLVVPVAVTTADTTGALIAAAVRTALGANATVTNIFTVGGTGANVTLTVTVPVANDSTLNIASATGTATGLTAAPTSTHTTAGALGTAVLYATSTNKDNVAALSLANVAWGQAITVGNNGLQITITSGGNDAFTLTEQYTVTVASAYTQEAPVSGGTYIGQFNTIYKVKVVKGALWSDNPQVVVTTNNGVDQAGPITVSYNTSFALGTLGATFKFGTNTSAAQNGLLQGEIYTVSVVASAKGGIATLTLANPIPTALATNQGDDVHATFFITNPSLNVPIQGYPEFGSLSLVPGATSFTVKAGIEITDPTWTDTDGVSLLPIEVQSANIFVTYTALLTAQAGTLQSLSDLSTVPVILGKVINQNPLAYGVNKALINSAGQPVYFLPVASDDVAGYTAALAALESTRAVYFKIPMSQDPDVLTLIQGHVDDLSGQNNWCYGLLASQFNNIVTLYGKQSSGANWTGYVSVAPGSDPAVYTLATVPGATFLTDGIQPGDFFRSDFSLDAFGNPTYVQTVISSVTDEENLVLVSPGFPAAVGNAESLQQIQIVRVLNNDQFAAAGQAISSAYADRRISNVFCNFPLADAPYFVAAAIAGLASSVAPHQPITNLAIQGFAGQTGMAGGSPTKLTPTQLDVMAGGGTLVVTQDVSGGPIYIRHQLTTDYSDPLHWEMSVTKNYDSIANYIWQILNPFIGQYNYNPNFVQMVYTQVSAALNYLQSPATSTPTAGSQIVSWDQNSLKISQNPTAATEVDIAASIQLPVPVNNIKFTMTASAA